MGAAKGSGGSDAILETLEEMQDKSEGTLSDARQEELGKAHSFAMVKADLENELKSRQEELAKATHAKQVSTEALAQADKDLASTKAALKDDTHFVQDLHKKCMLEAQEWEITHRDSVAELTALDSAKAILSKKFAASLLQTRSTQRLKLRLSSTGDAKSRALRAIQQLGKKFHSTALVSLAYRAAADPFAKVRGMIEDMIKKLMQEAAEEAEKKALCDKDISESQAAKDDKEGGIAKLDARIEKAESAIAELTEGISVLSKEIAEINTAVKEATAIREEEKSVFMVADKDLSESQEACAAALEVLQEYYEGGSFMQVSAQTRTKTASEGNDGSGILGVLELAESDFAQNLAEIRSAEKVAVDEYNVLMQDSKMSLAIKETEMKGKQSEVKSTKVGLRDNSADKEGLSSELDAVLEFLDMRQRECETKVPSYAEIKAARDAEIEGLKEALKILEE
jgi:chromosome segregation ATPase